MEISKVEIRQQLLDLQIGQFVKIAMREGSFIGGIFIKKSECLSPNGIKYRYSVRINDTTALDISEDSIAYVEVVDFNEDEIFYDLSQRTGIKTFDDDHHQLDANRVLRDIISCDAWDDFTEEEQEKVIKSLYVTEKDVTELIRVIRSLKKEYQNEGQKVIKLLDDKNDIVKDIRNWKTYYSCLSSNLPNYKIDLAYKLLRIDELLDKIMVKGCDV